MASQYYLQPNEAIILKETNVAHGGVTASYTKIDRGTVLSDTMDYKGVEENRPQCHSNGDLKGLGSFASLRMTLLSLT